ncbi:uncharacterized protein LOC122569789 [Bombus pyrosoma]|uniref:uncharacterized protein LOC122569789 n=1 Tax=Bombus pyrosoma TaxID=396416 RepID=UPI001CB9679F|nr:uncharacterized protein LOC122569789 [Bombus pyrosoma]
MVCYADDTSVLVGGRGWHDTLRIGEVATACAIRAVRGLGLRVSPAKSEAIWFYDKNRRRSPPPGLGPVDVRAALRLPDPKVTAAANALCGLLPNIGEAGVAVRRLYEGVVRSRVMYGTSVWADDLIASRCSILLLRRLHKVTGIRIIREYRTVSHASATVLVASPPWELRALVLKKRYDQRRLWNSGGDSAEQAAPDDLGTVEEDAWDQWRSQLISEGGEHRGAEAVLPNWGTWRSRRSLPLTYRLTQVLTGHGVFGEYLMKIRRETTDICHHCGKGSDTAQHTLESCPAWELPRRPRAASSPPQRTATTRRDGARSNGPPPA